MRWKDCGLEYSPLTLVLHWIGAALVFSLISLELIGVLTSEPIRTSTQPYRSLLWTALFFISTYRLWARLTSFHPLPVGTPSPVEVIISRSMATALLLAGVLLPIAHFLGLITAGKFFSLPGFGVLFPPIESYPNVRPVIDSLYAIGASAALAGLVLHIFGALKNHFILKNDTLMRMLGKKVEL